jgi:hypothetical protein
MGQAFSSEGTNAANTLIFQSSELWRTKVLLFQSPRVRDFVTQPQDTKTLMNQIMRLLITTTPASWDPWTCCSETCTLLQGAALFPQSSNWWHSSRLLKQLKISCLSYCHLQMGPGQGHSELPQQPCLTWPTGPTTTAPQMPSGALAMAQMSSYASCLPMPPTPPAVLAPWLGSCY